MNKKILLAGAALSGLLLTAGCANSGSKAAAVSKGECHGINSCKGTGDCGGKGYSCAGKNSCKGKGWMKMSDADCKAKGGKFKM
jgi:hypothetical protein